MADGGPLTIASLLQLAEILAAEGRNNQAAHLVDRLPFSEELTSLDLADLHPDDLIEQRFRYWRLCFLLSDQSLGLHDDQSSSAAAPTLDEIPQDVMSGRDFEETQLAINIDTAIRDLALRDVEFDSDRPDCRTSLWDAIEPMLSLFPTSSWPTNPIISSIRMRRAELIGLAADIAAKHGGELPQRLSDALSRRFEAEPTNWAPLLRMNLAETLRNASASVPWLEQSLRDYEGGADAEDVQQRMAMFEELAHFHARLGNEHEANRLANAAVQDAFGIGWRKDYQLDSWIKCLESALAESADESLVEDAAWMARFVSTIEPMTEAAAANAGVRLPGAIARSNPGAAVRAFEYLVRNGSVNHISALAGLVRVLVDQLDSDDVAAIEVAADLTGELIASAATIAYPDAAAAVVSAAKESGDPAKAAQLAQELAASTDKNALSSAREEWRRGLGLPAEIHSGRRTGGQGGPDDYGALVLSDGRRFGSDDVASLIDDVGGILDLRGKEDRESKFDWSGIVDDVPLSVDDVRNLFKAFEDDPKRHQFVLAALAESAESMENTDWARRIAGTVWEKAPAEGWARYGGGARRRAAGVLIRIDGSDRLAEVCRDLAGFALSQSWVPHMLTYGFGEIVRAVDPNISSVAVWREVRVYLAGMAQFLNLGDPKVFEDGGRRWWLDSQNGDSRAPSHRPSPSIAIAELAVRHLSHPSSLIRAVATTTVIRALDAGNADVMQALARFAHPDASDEILEAAGRCLAGSKLADGDTLPEELLPLELTLANHRCQIHRDLAVVEHQRVLRNLKPAYRLALPSGPALQDSPVRIFELHYRLLAYECGLEFDAVRRVAADYLNQALREVPARARVEGALRSTGMRHAFADPDYVASRAAFGRVVADLRDSGLLANAPDQIQDLLRTFDIDAFRWMPVDRPDFIPEPNHNETRSGSNDWLSAIDNRLEQYVRAGSLKGQVLIGAKIRLGTLNHDRLAEWFECGAIVGGHPNADRSFDRGLPLRLCALVEPTPAQTPSAGDCLIFENSAVNFNDPRCEWISFRTEFAAALNWAPVADKPGSWRTRGGDLAVETVYWVDGRLGRAQFAPDDTQSEGFAVVVTDSGRAELSDAFGPILRRFRIERSGRTDGAETETRSAIRNSPL
ncbi:MAG: hypothetical protein OXL33_02335 [Chloroflexota bacterium]|nr:hypothetical protein [Chloroflexota bacterium]